MFQMKQRLLQQQGYQRSAAIAQKADVCRLQGFFGVFAGFVCPKFHLPRVDLGRVMHPQA